MWLGIVHGCVPRPKIAATLLLILVNLIDIQMTAARRRKCPEGSWSEGKIIHSIMSNYTKMLPDAEDSVHVNVELHVQDMGSLNEITADFEIDILFTQYWHDPSLSFQNHSQCIRNITMESRYLQSIWTPNTCLINSKKTMVHASPTDNIMFILYDNGTVWINHRLSVKAPCDLDLRTFPFDTQTCTLLFESYSHNSEEVTLHWMDEPITLMKNIQLPDFDMVQFDTKRENMLYPNGYWDQLQVSTSYHCKESSRFQATFTFKRRYGFYILQAYVPTYLTIIVSWVSFCMEPKALPARTTVGVSSLLALTFQFGNILKNLPRVSYVKAMDVWMLGCISFVFGTMIELAIVCYITRCQSGQKKEVYPSSSASSSAVGTFNGATGPGLFGMAPPMSGGGLRYRPHANGSCRGEGSFHCMEPRVIPQRHSSGQTFCCCGSGCGGNGSTPGAGSVYRNSPSPPPFTGRLLRRSSTPPAQSHAHIHGNGGVFETTSFVQQQPLTFEQVNGHQPVPVYLRPPKRRHFFTIQPESIDKMSIVCFPLAFTLFNLIYWWYYLSQTFDQMHMPMEPAHHS
jgi:cation transporter family protein